ncbi:N-acetylglucosamine-6-phosphate deacetylase [Bacillus marinisedimentorum]|uniref:N-acetylglucosamine-6-phosphate deacetylase n=1 Tax=Bacillus marinisedimentorum TaxID=1821260 RepID=UPI000871CA21|nr:N-acetylglucosamine-6-phosphate deacetylase [Bacillus marinisedimentorum]
MSSSKRIVKNLQVYLENRVIPNGYVVMENGKITAAGDMDSLSPEWNSVEAISFSGGKMKAVPGFIDLHIHGADGADAMDATPEALTKIAKALPAEGTTSFLPTTMTGSAADIEQALENAADFIESRYTDGAEALGVHLEGPFISPKRAGAQHPGNIVKPDKEQFKKWQEKANGHIRLVTMAPEEEGGLELASYLKETGVIASIGHSDATYEQAVMGIKAGISHATHLFNGMRGLHHREPGTAGTVLIHDEVKAEIIADGIHVRPEMVKLAYKNKTRDGLIIITDAMRAKCLGKGTYDLGGQEVTVDETQATLTDGTLAGSILKLKEAVTNVMSYTGCSLEDIVQMAAVNPARQLGVFGRKGSIASGKDADITILDENHDVVMTFCRGRLVFEKQEGFGREVD